MANYYKKMILSFKSRSLIDQTDDAFRDVYNLKKDKAPGQENLKTPGDVSTTGLGSDFLDSAKPPDPWSATEERSVIPKWTTSFDGEDPDLNDKKPPMVGGEGWYPEESPLGINGSMGRELETPDRDNSVLGPHNQHSLMNQSKLFDKLKRRVR